MAHQSKFPASFSTAGPPAASCTLGGNVAISPDTRDPRSVDRLHERLIDLVRQQDEEIGAWAYQLNKLQAMLMGRPPADPCQDAAKAEEMSLGYQVDRLEVQLSVRRELLQKLIMLNGDHPSAPGQKVG